jgi:ribosomal protein S18 acetylase RimI-like enzyme
LKSATIWGGSGGAITSNLRGEKSRTYAVSELMVRPESRRTGVSDRLHQELLADLKEDLAVLLLDSTNPKMQAKYESWGYRKVGERQRSPTRPSSP